MRVKDLTHWQVCVGVFVRERERKTWKERWAGRKGRETQSERCYFALILQNSLFESKVKFRNNSIEECDFFY